MCRGARVAGELQVELVAADRKVWSGQASIVISRTTEGDIGIMPGHQPLLGLLVTGPVTIRTLADEVVTILAEVAELADEIDLERAEAALAGAGDDPEATRRAETRLRAAESR